MNVKAVSYIRAIEEGWSRPLLFRCDDGNQYVVKLLNNPQGIKVLPNEMIAFRLGRLLHLPVGECAIVHVSGELITQSPALRDMQVKAGPHLGSVYRETVKVLQNADDLTGCCNLDKAAGMIAFDHWIQNWDRADNIGNILVSKEDDNKKIVMIDHANAFTGSWTLDSLKENRTNRSVYWGKIYELFIPHISDKRLFKSALRQIQSLSKAELWTAMSGLPRKWSVSHTEQRKLVKYLEYRKVAAGEALKDLRKKF
ncbi:hypothetical protein SD71_04585 [Cohnella kolymensis]|uniref:HipA-like kinase domain-containing protein n=1 Tax=Cohnella kolymensis TaxID=1590652 RepID=A0ABR5A8I2_9BACL|nr:HipA family kinase [Cohnella kolymensis]KIL36978.1 hypothetical protein SD71_04585 [Cohnella kolymensis]